jgi:RNA polymerase sigma-70 factor (ECF subfamily)
MPRRSVGADAVMTRAHHELVQRATVGDRAALDALFERHLPGLLAFVRLRAGAKLRERESSLDVVQSACREVLADLREGVQLDEPHFRQWLFTAAERKLVDRARYHGRAKRDDGDARLLADETSLFAQGCASFTTPSGAAQAREELERLQRAFAALPDDYREVIALARIVGLSHADIAAQLGRNEGAVRVLLHRALARLAHEAGTENGVERERSR